MFFCYNKYMSWAGRRKFSYLLIIFLFILGMLALLLRPYYTKAPSCFDGKMNGIELGVDCGGSCALYCSSQVRNPVILWSRIFPVTDTIYNAVAYIENQNPTAVGVNANYDFRIYDDHNLMIAERKGQTNIVPNTRQVIFEGGIDMGTHSPKRSLFIFDSIPAWYKSDINPSTLPIKIDNIREPIDFKNPKLTARVTNNDLKDFPSFKVSAIVYDQDNNAQAVSQTLVDPLPTGGSQDIVFTWPYDIGKGVFHYSLEPIFDVLKLSQRK